MKMNRLLVFSVVIGCLCLVFPAGAAAATQQKQSSAALAALWNVPKLYENKNNPTIQSFVLVGRYHGQYWSVKSGGSREDGWENRRIYFGFNTRIFRQFTLELQINISQDFDPVYENIYDAFVKWENAENNLDLSVGRLDYLFTGMERSTSSKRIKTMERSLLVNQLMPSEVVGIYTTGKNGPLSYQTGLFSGSIEDEFTSFAGGFAAVLGCAYKAPFFYDNGTIHLEYLYNNGDADNNAFKSYGNIVSLWHEGRKGHFSLGIDLTAATALEDGSNVFGLTLLPTYDLINNLIVDADTVQIAFRYHYAQSIDEHGLTLNKRFEQEVATGEGDSYNSLYLGLNYLIYQQKLKLMAGLEYFDMAGVADEGEENTMTGNRHVNGWSFITGVRMYF